MSAHIRRKRRVTAKEGARQLKISTRTMQRYIAQPRAEWLEEHRIRRRAILETYENNDDLTWEDVGRKFGIKTDTARQLALRARKERQAEEDEKIAPPLPLDELMQTG